MHYAIGVPAGSMFWQIAGGGRKTLVDGRSRLACNSAAHGYNMASGWQGLAGRYASLGQDANLGNIAVQRSADAIEIRVPCKPEYVRTIRRTIADFAESVNMPRHDVEEIEIAASEAVANIVRHAYTNFEGDTPPVRVKCSHDAGRLTVEISDRGRGFEPPPTGVIPDVDLNRDGGLGIILIKCLMDRVKYASKPNGGTRIRMTKRAHREMCKAARVRKARLAQSR